MQVDKVFATQAQDIRPESRDNFSSSVAVSGSPTLAIFIQTSLGWWYQGGFETRLALIAQLSPWPAIFRAPW